jgi:DNA-binding transcriptional ArsR family regulator
MANRKPPIADKSTDKLTMGRFAYVGLDRTIHEKARLGIMTSLATHSEGLLFADLKQLCSLTDGNLSRHLQVLQSSGLVEVWKGSKNRRPQTLCRITRLGRKELLAYLAVLEKIVADAADARKTAGVAGRDPTLGGVPTGFSPA